MQVELRDPNIIIKLSRLGSFHQSKLSFLRSFLNEFKDREYKQDLFNLSELLKDTDSSIREMAEAEIKEKNDQLKLIEEELLKSLIPKDINDEKNSILEIRAGTGGDEASLFAADLFTMYQKYSELNAWKFDILSISETGLKGIKEAICNISGRNVFSKMNFVLFYKKTL